MIRLIPHTILALGLLGAGHAHATDVADDVAATVEEHNRLGVEHYQAGRYPDAIREMLAAYQLVPDPALLYNIARIYEKIDETNLAHQYYSRFVAEQDADPDLVARAIARMQALKNQPPAPAPVEATAPTETAEPEGSANPPTVAPEVSPARNTGALVLGTSGTLAMIGSGVAFTVALNKRKFSWNTENEFDARSQAIDAGQRLSVWSTVGVSIGAVMVGTSLLLQKTHTAQRTHLTPNGFRVVF